MAVRLIAPRAEAWPALAGLGLAVLALGPTLGRGFVLAYDMVFVPNPAISAATFGLAGGAPRAVPSDLVAAVLAVAIPADILQKIILILIFVLACSGAAALLAGQYEQAGRSRPPAAAALAAGVFYTWNPFMAERLLIGQWALLLGYAGLPWVLRAACTGGRQIRLGRMCAALIPAAVGGFAAMGVSALVAVPAALAGRRQARARRLTTVLAALVMLSLPWLVPALVTGVHTDPSGVDAFAARADTPFGRTGSLLMLGGIWNADTVPAGYDGIASAVWLLVVLVAVAGYVLIARPQRLCPGLGIAAIAGLAVAAIGVTGPSRAALRDLIAIWPGFAVLRDGQQYLAPLALAEAIGLGAVVAWVTGELKAGMDTKPTSGWGGGISRAAAVRAASALGVMAALAPVLLLPGLAWGATGRLQSVQYPADWLRARQIINDSPRPGAVVLLPWAAYRRFPWNGRRAVLDPWPRLLRRTVVWNDALQVGHLTVAAEEAATRRLNPIMSAAGPLTAALRTAGVRYVILDAGPLLARRDPGLAAAARVPGASVVLASGDLILFQLPARVARAADSNHALSGSQQKVTIRYRSGPMVRPRHSLGTCPRLLAPLPTPSRSGIWVQEDGRDTSRNHRDFDDRGGGARRGGGVRGQFTGVQRLTEPAEPAIVQLRHPVNPELLTSLRQPQGSRKGRQRPP